jgi:hypothetical protein
MHLRVHLRVAPAEGRLGSRRPSHSARQVSPLLKKGGKAGQAVFPFAATDSLPRAEEEELNRPSPSVKARSAPHSGALRRARDGSLKPGDSEALAVTMAGEVDSERNRGPGQASARLRRPYERRRALLESAMLSESVRVGAVRGGPRPRRTEVPTRRSKMGAEGGGHRLKGRKGPGGRIRPRGRRRRGSRPHRSSESLSAHSAQTQHPSP